MWTIWSVKKNPDPRDELNSQPSIIEERGVIWTKDFILSTFN